MSDMDAVNSFNAELQSLYDVKPPISKGKMTSITRAALKAVKLYKHVVQSVEKFIQKCKAEYKIPGLYVIDSIIRQSRHQFGPEKDVFAPRFSRNIQNTFVHLYRCPEEDKAKIIRVLNLWQKNSIFSPEVIQPLFDLADPQNPIWDQIGNQNSNSESGNALKNSGGGGSASNHASATNSSQLGFSSLPPVHFNKKVLDFDYGDGDDDGGQNTSSNAQGKNSDGNSSGNPGPLDALGSILSNPEILRQLQTLQEQMAAAAVVAGHNSNYASTPEQERQRKLAELSKQEAAFDQRLAETVARLPFAKDCELPIAHDGDSRGDSSGVDQNSNQLSSGQSGNNPNVLLPPAFFQQLAEQQSQNQHQHQQQSSQQQLFQTLLRNASSAATGVNQQNPFSLPMNFPIQGVPPPFPPQDVSGSSSSVPHHGLFGQPDSSAFFNHMNSNQHQHHHQPQITISQKIYEEIDLCAEDSKEESELSSTHMHRAGDRDRSSRSKRSRSHDRHDSGRRGRRSRSRSRGRSKRSYRSRSRERAREDREKEKERQRKGLPSIKKEHMSICSTTLWVGHLSKLVSQEEISDTFGTYGDIVSIDLIPPRGCAFIVMNRRQDAVRALDRLKNTKLQGKTITLAWAPGKGVKGKEWKDYWEVGDGVSYIPWNKLREDINLEEFEDGGCIDEDTLPDFLRNRPQPPLDGMKSHDQKTLVPPLPLDNENSQDSNSMIAPPLPPPTTIAGMPGAPPPTSGIPSLLDHAALAAVMGKAGDTDARQDAPPPMPPTPFGMGPPGMGMMPMGMNLMVPPPMLAMAPGHFQGMASLPGMPAMMGMGMVPAPTLPVPPVSSAGPNAPGLLGEIPPQPPPGIPSQLNDSLLNSSNDESALSASDIVNNCEEAQGSKRGKKRSRFDDPDEKMSPAGDNSLDTGNFSPSQNSSQMMKDDRPVFERLKSLAEGYSFGNQDKQGAPGSLLGNPPGMGPRPLMPNSFSQPQPAGLLGTRPVRPPSLFSTAPRHQSPGGGWGFGDNSENPFLNPNPNNPFAAAAASGGNPFVAGSFSGSDNPFDIAGSSGGNPFAPPAGNDRGGFGGGRRGGWGRDGGEWGGRGRGGRGGRGGWRGGRGAGGWGSEPHQVDDLMENDLESRGGFRGGRGGRGRDPWGGRGSDKSGDRRDRGDRDRPRSREGDRGSSRSRRSRSPSQRRDDSERGSRRRRNSSNEKDSRRSRHRSPDESRRRSDRRQDNFQSSHSTAEQAAEEDWENEGQTQNQNNHEQQSQAAQEESWGDSQDNIIEINPDENNEQRNHPQQEEENSRLSENPWASENQEENEYPPQEEVIGEEQYPSQDQEEGDRSQYEMDMEQEADHHHHHEKTDEGEGYDDMTNNEEMNDASHYENENNEYDGGGEEECDQDYRNDEVVYNENQNENHHESYEDSSYGNHQEADSNSNDYSNYNNEQNYDSRNNGGDYCGEGDYSGEYNDDDDGERQEPQSTSYDNEEASEPVPTPPEEEEEGEAHNTKCTSFSSVNSSNNSAPEEMNSISS